MLLTKIKIGFIGILTASALLGLVSSISTKNLLDKRVTSNIEKIRGY